VISAQEVRSLLPAAQWLKIYPSATITIEGHTDEDGTREYNFALGERRAVAMERAFIAFGIPPERMKTVSYGNEKPVVEDATGAQNRCAVATITSN
jgi:peptidoglycan-associated lipoprotein